MFKNESKKVDYEKRIPELDALRGLAILLMAAHHFIFDLRHIFGLDVLAFQDSVWFMDWIRPVILFLFLTVSGISSAFSRNNFKRALRLLLFSLAVTLAFELVSYFTAYEMHVWFNVFHLLTLGVFFYALLTAGENKRARRERETADPAAAFVRGRRGRITGFLLLLGMLFLYYGYAVANTPYLEHNYFFIFGLHRPDIPPMGDYLPMFPWFGMFLLGAAAGRIFYPERKSLLCCGPRRLLLGPGRPLLFLGRHPLLIYALHQPLLLLLIGIVLKAAGRI